MANFDDESHSFPTAPAPIDQGHQAALRKDHLQKQLALEQRAALIKEKFEPQLSKAIAIADIQDDNIKDSAFDLLAHNIAARGVIPDQMRVSELHRLAVHSIGEAYKLQEAEREKQEQTPSVRDDGNPQSTRDDSTRDARSRNGTRDYGELQQTHAEVAEAQKQSKARSTSADAATAVQSKEQLQDMAAHYAAALDIDYAKPEETQELLVGIDKVTTLMYEIIFHLIGYEEEYTDYSEFDHPPRRLKTGTVFAADDPRATRYRPRPATLT